MRITKSNRLSYGFSSSSYQNPKYPPSTEGETTKNPMEWNGSEMEITLIIDLQDHTGLSHRKTSFNLSSETTVEQLKGEIKSLFLIDKQHQELYFKGDQILSLNSTLQRIGLMHENTIFVKHSYLDNWKAYLVLIESFNKVEVFLKKKKALEALEQLNILEKSNFFLSYPKFVSIKESQYYLIACYEDLVDSKIEDAVKAYFNRIYAKDNPSSPPLNFTFMRKPQKGIQGGCICEVTTEQGIITFYVKSHCERTSHSMDPIDLRELFVYFLLFSINMGPEAHFVSNKHGSNLGLYIITKEVPGFMIASKTNIGTKQMAQLKLLENILYLTDLHSNNYGLDDNGCLFIVDFQVSLHKFDSKVIMNNFQEGFKTNGIEVAKESFQTWNLLNKVDEANRRIKEIRLEDNNLSYMEKYEEYYNLILRNVHCFIDVINSK